MIHLAYLAQDKVFVVYRIQSAWLTGPTKHCPNHNQSSRGVITKCFLRSSRANPNLQVRLRMTGTSWEFPVETYNYLTRALSPRKNIKGQIGLESRGTVTKWPCS